MPQLTYKEKEHGAKDEIKSADEVPRVEWSETWTWGRDRRIESRFLDVNMEKEENKMG